MKRNLLFCAMFFALITFSSNTNILASTKLTTEDFTYEVNADGNTLTIVSGIRDITGPEYHVKSQVEIGGKVYRVTKINKKGLNSVRSDKLYIDEGIEEVFADEVKYCFHGDVQVKEIVLPSTVRKLGHMGYDSVRPLERITISKDNPYICVKDNFVYTKNMKKVLHGNAKGKVVIPNGVEEIADNAFENENLTSLKLPKSLKKIGKRAFSECWSLEAVSMSPNVKVIGESAFYECRKLKKVSFSTKLEKIGAAAFANTKLKNVKLGKRVKTIGGKAFRTDSIKKITIDKRNPYIKAANNAIFSKDGKTLINANGVSGNFLIPHGVTKIKRYAFAFNHKINCIVIKGNVKSLPEGCFVGSSLKKITLPKQMKRLEKECLASCFKLRKIDLPDSLAYIGKEAFAHCGFKELIIPEKVKSIGQDALFCSVGHLEFLGDNPPKLGYQRTVEWEKRADDGEEDDDDEYEPFMYEKYGVKPGIKVVVVPYKAFSKYKKALKDMLEYDELL